MGRVSAPDCRGSKRKTFRLAASLCHPSLAKVVGLGFVEAKRRVVAARHPQGGQPCSGCGSGRGRWEGGWTGTPARRSSSLRWAARGSLQ